MIRETVSVVSTMIILVSASISAASTYMTMESGRPSGRSFIGPDDRQAADPRVWPHRSIVRLLKKDGSHLCNGTTVAPRLIIGAGHCIFKKGRFLSSDQRAAFAETWSGRRFPIRQGTVPREFRGFGFVSELPWEIGFFETSEDVSEETRWMGVAKSLEGTKEVYVAGYHNGVFMRQKCFATFFSGWFVRDRVQHTCDVVPGLSGAPIFTQKSNGKFYLLGVNAGATGNGRFNYGATVVTASPKVKKFVFQKIWLAKTLKRIRTLAKIDH